jgi:D-xylose transport system ATP-binding protein
VTPLLTVTGASKRYGAVEALRDVDITVDAGEVVALAGDNGAGKSTLVKAISGVAPADEATIAFEGREVHIRSPHDASDLGIAVVYQDLALCDNLDVVANLYLGTEARECRQGSPWSPGGLVAGGLRFMDEIAMEGKASELLHSLSVRLPSVRAEVGTLSGGQRQSVAISRALLGEPKLVVLDEPTAALGVSQTAQVLELVERLRSRGLGVLIVSHNLADVFEVADRIVVLRLGRNAGEFPGDPARHADVVGAITGATVAVAG